MAAVTEQTVIDALRTVIEPELHKDLVTLNMVKDLKIEGGTVKFTVVLTTPACPLKTEIKASCDKAVGAIPGVTNVEVDFTATVQQGRSQLKDNLIPTVKNTIAISSGKGGVGKTTVAVNLAVGLALQGAKVGLMDTDVYGPNVPMMMGVERPPEQQDGKLLPAYSHGVKLISMGFFVPDDQPLTWRGPMIHTAIQQFLRDVIWGDLDYLVVDLPPGTGDAQLSIPFLGRVPIDPAIRVGGDIGLPLVVANPDSPQAKAFMDIASRIAARISVLTAAASETIPVESLLQKIKKPLTSGA